MKIRNNLMSKNFSRWNKSVPRYKEFQSIIIEAVIKNHKRGINILELGMGKGNTALSLLEKFPAATYEGIDGDKNSLLVAKKQLKKFPNIILNAERYLNFKPSGKKYDIVLAILAFHNSSTNEKKLLFRRIKSWLKNGGTFIIGDFFKLTDPDINEKWISIFKEHRKTNLPKEELQIIKKNKSKNLYIIEALEDTIKMLRRAGFKTIDIIWCYYRMAIIRAK